MVSSHLYLGTFKNYQVLQSMYYYIYLFIFKGCKELLEGLFGFVYSLKIVVETHTRSFTAVGLGKQLK
jgi:hypothetical protein